MTHPINKIISNTAHNGIGVLLAVCLGAVILPISFSGGAIATPAIGRDLGGSAVALNWITNAFMLTFGSLLMAAGALADQFGRKRIFLTGIACFAISSLCLSFAPSIVLLDLLRALQGVAAALALSGGSAALAQTFEGSTRMWAFSMLGTTFGVGLAFGPILTGLLIEHLGWRSIFLASAAIGIIAFCLGYRSLRESHDPEASKLDWSGTLTFTSALSLFTFGLIQAPTSGWSSLLVCALLTGSLLFLVLFIRVETISSRPMLDLSLFRYPRFIGVQVLPIATCYGFVVLLILLPLRFIGIEGYSEIHTGLLMIALSAPMLIVPALAAILTRWFSAGIISGVGLLITAAGLFWLSQITPTATGYNLIAPLFLIGFGTGLPWGLMDGLSVSVVPKERAGMATGIFGTTRVAGEGIALVVVSAVLSALVKTNLHLLEGAPESNLWQRASDAAPNLATGNLKHTLLMLPEISPTLLIQSYNNAFQSLLYILIVITLLSALAVFFFLGHPPHQANSKIKSV